MRHAPTEKKTAETAVRGLLFAVALVLPVLLGVFFQAFSLVSTASFGAMFALLIAPRHGITARIAGIGIGGLLVVLAAALGVALHGRHNLVLVLLFLLSWLAALPRPDQAYLGLIVKYVACSVLLTSFGISASLVMALAFLGGIALGICLSLVGMAFETDSPEPEPLDEFKAFMHGATNGRLFGVAVPVTVLASTLAARYFSFSDPAWVGLTVLFVMHSDGATELFRVWARTLGTLAGVLVSGVILYTVGNPLLIGLGIGLFAFAIPFVVKDHYILFSFVITCAVLLLIDISMFQRGGDFPLLRWRLIDTVIACAWVLASNLTLRLIRWLRHRKEPAPAPKA
ncbi:FUSC family protein [Desulfovibrio sp. ZJ369]|uniref:FUSC family protein n=1 Tax=Desulfovibrio sp. ZJ369 TaxID=2709793 RepID=UPI0013EB98C6|nr:FUSC family protein [Desulfovibrio sp. ZJ369]